MYIKRHLPEQLQKTLKKHKSILLLGPRQTGKTTLLKQTFKPDKYYSLVIPDVYQRFETNPSLLIKEIEGLHLLNKKQMPFIIIDEIQKVPSLLDPIQHLIDTKQAQFILTGSSARKLRQPNINWLPGRVIHYRLDPLSLLEMQEEQSNINLKTCLLFGTLPEVFLHAHDVIYAEELLESYVSIYLDQEIRQEALARNLGAFHRFLNYAAVDAGHPTNILHLAQEIGVSRHTIADYYQILEDCLVADRIEPLTKKNTRRRLTKAPKYLFFDLGVRRIAAGESNALPTSYYGHLFEQFIGIELLKLIRRHAPQAKLYYWRDHNGPEVDYILAFNRRYLPIEVKYSHHPKPSDAKHLNLFMKEYDCEEIAYIICQTEEPFQIAPNILAVNWKQLPKLIEQFLKF